MEGRLIPHAEAKTDENPDGLLSVTDLVNMFDASEDATIDARKLSERDRDYVDNKQLTAEEIAELNRRGQPPVIINRIKRKVDYLKGHEMSQRIDPRALPRTPQHEQDAEGVEQALRYVADDQNVDHKRSQVWDNLIVEGMAGWRVGVEEKYDGICVKVDRIPWDRMFYDPHSSEPDFSDAAYLGVVRWEDYAEAVAQYPEEKDALEWTLNDVSESDTYDDKPKHRLWADKVRKRVRICQIWVKRFGDWYWSEFTKGGILKAGKSPHVNDKGETDCEIIFASAYVNRDNERYGLVRELISPQDEINKRRSKALHLLSVEQTVIEEGVVQDVEKMRRERARPDGVTVVAPGALANKRFEVQTRTDLATGHLQLLQETKNEIDMIAGNIALQGNALNKSSASGKAIIASQQGGAMEIAPLIDQLRHADIRLFRAIWARIRQYWTAEKWVRVTDDERNIKWLGINVDPMRMQMAAQQDPAAMEKIAGVVGNVATLDIDIIIDDAPDGITPQLEQFQSLVELKKMDAMNELPFRAILTAMPNLKNKEQVLKQMDEAKQGPGAEEAMAAQMQAAQMQVQMQLQAKQAESEQALMAKQAESELQLATKQREAQISMTTAEREAELELEKKRAEIEMQTRAKAEMMRERDEEKARKEQEREAGRQEVGPENREILKALAESTAAIQMAVTELIESQGSDTEIVRDEATGRAIGARKVRKQREAA